MTPAEIRQAIAESPTLTDLLPDSQAIADAMSEGRTRANGTEIGVGMILATIGLASGNALLRVRGGGIRRAAGGVRERGAGVGAGRRGSWVGAGSGPVSE